MGAVENLSVAQLPLHVAHDTLPQGGHAGQVVCECRIHDAKDALPAFSRMSRLSSLRVAGHSHALIGAWCHRLRRSVRRIRRSEVRRMRTVAPAAAWITTSV